MTKLPYVGNLPSPATEDAVRALFAPHGAVEKLSLISDRDTGRARGFGFVEMSSADASRAMQALNGQDFDGRPLKINEAQRAHAFERWSVPLLSLRLRSPGAMRREPSAAYPDSLSWGSRHDIDHFIPRAHRTIGSGR